MPDAGAVLFGTCHDCRRPVTPDTVAHRVVGESIYRVHRPDCATAQAVIREQASRIIEVVLSPADLERAARVGKRRLREAKGKPRWSYEQRSGEETHVLGAQAELAFCRGLGLDWPAFVGTYRRQPDVLPDWEVRWSSRESVKVSTDDPAAFRVVLVMGEPPRFRIMGYIGVADARRRFPLEDPGQRGRPAHFVPVSRLRTDWDR